MKNISQYVDRAKQMLVGRQTSLPLIKKLLTEDGCNAADVMSCVYGACADIIQDSLPTEKQVEAMPEKAVNANAVPIALKQFCPELSDQEVQDAIAAMLAKQIIIFKNGMAFSGTRRIVNSSLDV